MPPYLVYRGGLPPMRISGKYESASSSQVVTCARISLTDHSPMTPGSINCGSEKPVYDSWSVFHVFSSRSSNWYFFMIQPLPPSE